jgi:protein-S-isoprenylcysteine O-methyltransferase Ste14
MMSRLELKIPPDVVWILVAGLMWLVSQRTPTLVLPSAIRVGTAVAFTVVGIWFIVSARASLDKAKTTWRPMTPGQVTSLVSTGVYRLSRNPIYLGMLLAMLGFAVVLSSPAALALSAVFVVYVDRFQIRPEERALSAVLGQEYLDYRARVRRWL